MNRCLAPAAQVRGAVFLLALATSQPSFGHDLWLVPGAYVLRSGETTRIFINNGDRYPESLTLFDQSRVIEMRRRGPDSESTISDFRVDGRSLTFDFRSETNGTHVLGLTTRPRRVRLTGEDFEDYLLEEGLTGIAEIRQERGEVEKAAVERYQKWAKAIVDVGDGSGIDESPWSRALGHPIEIVPLAHPNRLKPGSELPIRVLFRGEPIAGVPVRGSRASGPPGEISVSTDGNGEAVVKVDSAGRWYVKAMHMVESVDDPDVDWDSYWCTLSFEVARRTQ